MICGIGDTEGLREVLDRDARLDGDRPGWSGCRRLLLAQRQTLARLAGIGPRAARSRVDDDAPPAAAWAVSPGRCIGLFGPSAMALSVKPRKRGIDDDRGSQRSREGPPRRSALEAREARGRCRRPARRQAGSARAARLWRRSGSALAAAHLPAAAGARPDRDVRGPGGFGGHAAGSVSSSSPGSGAPVASASGARSASSSADASASTTSSASPVSSRPPRPRPRRPPSAGRRCG